ncbi:MAG: FtsH protease activity modulator HflK [Sphingomonas bacterium]|nr:FtsH protease activity modulator HflK [Sphingomonas bacterium]
MSILSGLGSLPSRLFSDNKGPWGPKADGGGDDAPSTGPPSDPIPGPWGGERPSSGPGQGGFGQANLEAFIERNRRRFGGGFGDDGSSGGPSGSKILWVVLAVLALGMLLTTMHRIGPEERGVVTLFGRYSSTLPSGISFTLPAPIARVQKVNVAQIRDIELGSAAEETLMLTGDQNIIDIAYQVRWSIRNPEQYLFELRTPEDTIRQVAESSMRQVVAQVSLQDAIGNKRGEIEARVQEEMQRTLDRYQSGVSIRGVAIKQADPPGAVNDAFKDVTAAQQDSESARNNANAYALQLRQIAQGEATAFDKVYVQYKLSPEVTRRRMYYETMERVLRGVDKTIIETPGGVTPYLPLPQIQRSTPERQPAQ